ncbi:hypothetical protein L0Y46_05145, partial [bacterium]|nr:hypothetical protein [bacterium]
TTNSLAIYPTDTTDVLIIGNNATSSVGYIFEVVGSSLFDGGTLTVDGTYHMMFRLYTVPTGGAAIWTEDRSTAAGDRITVYKGVAAFFLI